MKDKYSILRSSSTNSSIIHATSHDDKSIDYKHACRIFALARASPSLMAHLMWAVAKRAEGTRSWPVALKSLLLAHGLLILTSSDFRGRLPFNLSHFRDRLSKFLGFSVFVRAYFEFLDNRGMLLNCEDEDEVCRIEKMQALLDILLKIYPCSDSMKDACLVIEAMDCVLMEIFEVCSKIYDGIAVFLVRIEELSDMQEKYMCGLKAMRVLKRAKEQSTRLEDYLDVCKSLNVPNATEFPGVEKIPEYVMKDLERLLMDDEVQKNDNFDWVIFEDDLLF